MLPAAFRERKKRGEKREDLMILKASLSCLNTLSSPGVYPEIKPKNDIGYNAMLSSKAAILKLWK